MARAIGDFFDAFNQGYDTTGRIMRDAEMSRIARAKPEEITTPVETMQGFEGAAPDATGATSQMDLADAPMAQQKTGFRLLGQTYNQAPSEAAIANARMRAMADAISSDDPAQGLRLRQQVTQSERDDERFGMERQRFDREGREGDLRMAALGRADRQGQRIESFQAIQDEVAKLPEQDLRKYAAQFTNLRGEVPLLYTGKTKQGYSFMTTNPQTGEPTGETFSFNSSQLRQLATAARAMDAGFGAEGSAMLASVSKELNDHIAQLNNVTALTTNSQNSAVHLGNQGTTARISANAAATNAGANARYTDARTKEIETDRANNEKARKLYLELEGMTPEQRNGPEGIAKTREFNMLNAKPGTQLNLGLPRGGGSGASAMRYETDNLWADAEKKLIGANTPVEDIQKQKDSFYARRGFATDAAIQALQEGRDPNTGRRLTEADLDAFNRTFPYSRVDREEVPWLKGKPPKGATPAAQAPMRPFTSADLRSIQRNLAQPSASPAAAQGLPTPRQMGANADLMAVVNAFDQERLRRNAAVTGAGGLDLSNLRPY